MSQTNLGLNHGEGIRLLIVDDEPHVRSMLVRAFNLIGGYDAGEATGGEEALAILAAQAYDVMILDLYMPDVMGLDVMYEALKIQPELLIIILTGNASLQSAISAMRSDAVDYLIKPVRFCEVAKSVANALRKREDLRGKLAHAVDEVLGELCQDNEFPPAAPPTEKMTKRPVIMVPPVQLDRNNKSVKFMKDGDRAIELTEGETAVLSSLMTAPNQPLSCEQLVYASWGYHMDDYTAGSVVRPYISRLRKKIEPDPKNPRLICTVRGRGYLFSSIT